MSSVCWLITFQAFLCLLGFNCDPLNGKFCGTYIVLGTEKLTSHCKSLLGDIRVQSNTHGEEVAESFKCVLFFSLVVCCLCLSRSEAPNPQIQLSLGHTNGAAI